MKDLLFFRDLKVLRKEDGSFQHFFLLKENKKRLPYIPTNPQYCITCYVGSVTCTKMNMTGSNKQTSFFLHCVHILLRALSSFHWISLDFYQLLRRYTLGLYTVSFAYLLWYRKWKANEVSLKNMTTLRKFHMKSLKL